MAFFDNSRKKNADVQRKKNADAQQQYLERQLQNAFKKAYQEFIGEVKRHRALPTITSSIFLKSKEQAFLEEPTTLRETRAVRIYSGDSFGGVFRIAKGIYLGGSSTNGTSESHQEWRTIDNGALVLTDRRMVFCGQSENRSIPIDRIVSIKPLYDAIVVSAETRKKSMMFTVNNSAIWSTVLWIIRTADDPFELGNLADEMNLEVH